MVNDFLLSHGLYTRSSAGCIYPSSRELGDSLVAMIVAYRKSSYLLELVVGWRSCGQHGIDVALLLFLLERIVNDKFK